MSYTSADITKITIDLDWIDRVCNYITAYDSDGTRLDSINGRYHQDPKGFDTTSDGYIKIAVAYARTVNPPEVTYVIQHIGGSSDFYSFAETVDAYDLAVSLNSETTIRKPLTWMVEANPLYVEPEAVSQLIDDQGGLFQEVELNDGNDIVVSSTTTSWTSSLLSISTIGQQARDKAGEALYGVVVTDVSADDAVGSDSRTYTVALINSDEDVTYGSEELTIGSTDVIARDTMLAIFDRDNAEDNFFKVKVTYDDSDGSTGDVTLSNVKVCITPRHVVNHADLSIDMRARLLHLPYWDDILEKPSTFAPATHTHSYDDLTNLPAAVADPSQSSEYNAYAVFTLTADQVLNVRNKTGSNQGAPVSALPSLSFGETPVKSGDTFVTYSTATDEFTIDSSVNTETVVGVLTLNLEASDTGHHGSGTGTSQEGHTRVFVYKNGAPFRNWVASERLRLRHDYKGVMVIPLWSDGIPLVGGDRCKVLMRADYSSVSSFARSSDVTVFQEGTSLVFYRFDSQSGAAQWANGIPTQLNISMSLDFGSRTTRALNTVNANARTRLNKNFVRNWQFVCKDGSRTTLSPIIPLSYLYQHEISASATLTQVLSEMGTIPADNFNTLIYDKNAGSVNVIRGAASVLESSTVHSTAQFLPVFTPNGDMPYLIKGNAAANAGNIYLENILGRAIDA